MNQTSFLAAAYWRVRRQFHTRRLLSISQKRVLREAFVKMVLKHLPGQGWRFDGSQFTRIEAEAEQIFYASITDQKIEFWIKIAMGVRVGEIERIWQESQRLERQPSHWTIYGDVSQFIRHPQVFLEIDHVNDVDFFEPKIGELIEQACIPFWKRFASIADLDREWNPKPFDFKRVAADVLHHATRSVIVAKLAKNPAFEELVAMRRGEVTRLLNISLQEKGLEQFERLVEWLRQ